MTIIKKYFLCALMLNTVSLFGMFGEAYGEIYDTERLCLAEVRDTIDEKYLGIGKYTCCRSITGSIASYYATTRLPKGKAAAKLQKIVSDIPQNNNKERIFKGLFESHWYVNYLVHNLVQEKTKKFFKVNGSTIDKLREPTFDMIKKIVHEKARQSFLSQHDLDFNKSLTEQINGLLYKDSKDINFMVLYGYKKKISLDHLRMSADSKYIELNDTKNDVIVWDMKTGEKPTLSPTEYNTIQWLPKQEWLSSGHFHYIADNTKKYCATTNSHASSGKEGFIPVKIDTDKNGHQKSAIIIYKLPEPRPYLCELAFKRNKDNREELIALKNSNSFKTIEGFPRKNLERLIEKRITQLSKDQKISNLTI